MESSHIQSLEEAMMTAMEPQNIRDPLIITGNQILVTRHHRNHIASKKKMIRIIQIKIDRNILPHHVSSKILIPLVQEAMTNPEWAGDPSVKNMRTIES